MLSGTPTQNATSVADLPTLLGLDDTPYKNGEMAFVVSLQRYFALNYGAPAGAGVPAKSGHGQWIIYSAAQAVIPGVGAPTIPVTIGALYLDTATGALYAGDSAPAWVAVGGGAPPTPVRPAPPAGTTHNWNFDQAALPPALSGLVVDTVGTNNLLLTATGGLPGVDFLAQEPRPFTGLKGTRLIVANGNYTLPPVKIAEATLAPTDNPNAGYTIGSVWFADTITLGSSVVTPLFGAHSTVSGDSLFVSVSKGTFVLSAQLGGVTYTSGNFQSAGIQIGTMTLAIEFDANAINEQSSGVATAAFTNGSNTVTLGPGAPAFKPGDFIRNNAGPLPGPDPITDYAQIVNVSGTTLTLASGYTGTTNPAAVYEYVTGPANLRLYANGELVVSVPVANGLMANFDQVAIGSPGWTGNLFTATGSLPVAALLAYTTGYIGL